VDFQGHDLVILLFCGRLTEAVYARFEMMYEQYCNSNVFESDITLHA